MKTTISVFLIGLIFISNSYYLHAQKTSLYVSPHPDDWQLFMNPNAYLSIKNSSEKVIFLHTTGGDGGSGNASSYYLAREEGSLRAIRFMSNTYTQGIGTNMNSTIVTINGHPIQKFTYRNAVAYFLRLPDGNLDGSGYARHSYASLKKLYEKSISSISAIDASTTYNSLNDLETTIRLLILSESNSSNIQFNLGDNDLNLNPGDHSDHINSSLILQDVAASIGAVSIRLYEEYDTGSKPQNIFGNDLLVDAATWGATTSGLSDLSNNSTWDDVHIVWIGKQYFRTLNDNLDHFPTAINDNAVVAVNGTLNSSVSGNDNGLNDAPVTFTRTSNVKNGTLIFNSDGSYRYTPNLGFSGSDSFTYTVCDVDGDCSSAVVTITASSVSNTNIALNKPTTASSSEAPSSNAVDGIVSTSNWWGANPYSQWWQVDLQNVYTINKMVVVNYYDGTRYYKYNVESSLDGTNWTKIVDFSNNTTPATIAGNTFIVSNASARYLRVDMNFNSANVGVHIVEFEAYGTLSNGNVGLVPLAVNDSGIMVVNGTLNGSVAGNDIGLSATPITFTKTTDVQNGSLTFNSDGSFAYSPNQGFVGTDSFTYTVCDADGNCSSAAVTIAISSVNNTNIALNKPTTASSYETPSSNAVDGIISNSNWWGASPYSQWWQVDLQSEYSINKLVVFNYYDGTRYYQYNIESSLDGINWTKIVDFHTNTTPATSAGNTFIINNATARYLRVDMNYNSANVGVHIVEFQAYGTVSTNKSLMNQTLVNGQESLKMLSATQPENTFLSLYPNPIVVGEQIKLVINLPYDEKVSVTVNNMKGNILQSNDYTLFKGLSEISISSIGLPAGIYFIKTKAADRIETKTIIVK